jgi:hypothetical protein
VWTIAPAGADITVTTGKTPGTVADVSSNGHSFINWGTQRSDWREHCKVTGDESVAAQFLDALNII